VQCDASPWGAGAALFLNGVAVEYFQIDWSQDLAEKFGTELGNPEAQTLWEYMVIYLLLLVWGTELREHGIAIMGDNIAALSGALNLKGRSKLSQITREISWRKCRFGWRFCAGHLPSELNGIADALSRLSAPLGSDKKEFPVALLSATARALPPADTWWISEL